MKVLLIGGTGVLGRAIAAEALRRGCELFTLADDSGSFPSPEGAARHLTVDRNDEAAMRAAFAGWSDGIEWDLVIDAVCYTEHQAMLLHSLIAGRTTRLVVISSTIIYGADQPQPISEMGAIGDAGAIGTYGLGKLAIERFWASSRGSGIAPTILRLPHVLGKGAELGPVPLHNRDPHLLSSLQRGKPLLLADGGRQLLQVVFNEDVARTVFELTSLRQTFGEIYNCCNPEIVTALAYYREIARLLDTELEVVGLELDALEQSEWGWLQTARSRVFSSEKLRGDTGLTCTTAFGEAIRQTLEHLRGKHAAPNPLEAQFAEIGRLARNGRAELAAALTGASGMRRRNAVDKRMNG